MAEGGQKRKGECEEKVLQASEALTLFLTFNDLRNIIAVNLHLVTLLIAIAH